MAITSAVIGDQSVSGTVYASDVRSNNGTPFPAERFEQQHQITVELYGPTTTVAALTKWVYTFFGATGELLDVDAFIAVVATGADRTITVDVQKSTGAGAFATIMTATIGFTNASAVRTAVSGTLAAGAGTLVAGDILQVVVTVAGAAGNQATGLTVSLKIREKAD